MGAKGCLRGLREELWLFRELLEPLEVVTVSGVKRGEWGNGDGAVKAEIMMETKIGFSLPRSDSESLGLGRPRAI